jgi:formate hydrogenlyase subunit 3/multisubunit Na+/H+ antiporter MnhD subunit
MGIVLVVFIAVGLMFGSMIRGLVNMTRKGAKEHDELNGAQKTIAVLCVLSILIVIIVIIIECAS